MIIVNKKDNTSRVVRVHEKMPSYMDKDAKTPGIAKTGKIDDQDVSFVLKPVKEGGKPSKRVNFQVGKVYYYVDDETLHSQVSSGKGLDFVLTDRAAKAAEAKAAKAEEKKAAKTEAKAPKAEAAKSDKAEAPAQVPGTNFKPEKKAKTAKGKAA